MPLFKPGDSVTISPSAAHQSLGVKDGDYGVVRTPGLKVTEVELDSGTYKFENAELRSCEPLDRIAEALEVINDNIVAIGQLLKRK